mmetsp:Transcript_22347/g.63397  ORF Transcript_22347/g.63397 Transcript_22347/m.63397 type:complete len:202 (-) Transcript_22347:194-799(-)
MRAGRAGSCSRSRRCAASSRRPRCSPRPSARRACSSPSMRGTNFWKAGERHSSATSRAAASRPPPPGPSLARRKSTQATTFSCVPGESLPCCSSAQRQPRGNCCVDSSNLWRFLSITPRNSVFFRSSTSARVFWKGAEKNSRKRFLCVVQEPCLFDVQDHGVRDSSFPDNDCSHDAAKWWFMLPKNSAKAECSAPTVSSTP